MNLNDTDRIGFERILRHALATQMMLRLRPMMLHTLKGPTQTIVSALHMLQKTLAAAETAELAANRQRYVDWIKEAASKLGAISDAVLPQKLGIDAELESCDLAGLTEDVAHLFRDEAALAGIEFQVAAATHIPAIRARCEEFRLALQAILCGVLDRSPQETILKIALQYTHDTVEWSIAVPARPDAPNPSAEAFDLRFDLSPPQPGIGWYVARSIINEHGGTVMVDDAGAEGWLLKLRLPSYLPNGS